MQAGLQAHLSLLINEHNSLFRIFAAGKLKIEQMAHLFFFCPEIMGGRLF
jgi:hypothetical protein